MNFRLVWVGEEDDPDGQGPARAATTTAGERGSGELSYGLHGTQMVRRVRLENGRVKCTPVANFIARIVSDVLLDQDAWQQREFGVEAELAGHRFAFRVPATEFHRMGWFLKHLGPGAIVYPGQQQHARAAIQWLSNSIRQERIFGHLGWSKQGADWVYLQPAGSLSAHGPRCDLTVQLPAALEFYSVRSPEPTERANAVRASLRFLSLAPDRISFPLLAAVYRAPFGNVDFSLFLTGRTGTFKTAMAALCQQHFGAEMDAGRLPANFASTANSLEHVAFAAKDALLVVDDFVPTGGAGDNLLHGVAERLFRAVGNHQGRNRMGSNRQLRPSQSPRALLLATGEEVPRGQSIRARLLIVEVQPGDVHRSSLTDCQNAAQQGHFAASMAAFISWIAGRYEQLQQLLDTRVRELRNHYPRVAHARLPTTLAQLQCGFEMWLQFALEVGAIEATERAKLEQRNAQALIELAALQTKYHQASDPALRFISLLGAVLACGFGHVADRSGKAPESPEQWGWRQKPNGRGWVAQGVRVGWVSSNDLFLDPAMSYRVIQEMAGAERLAVSEQTLRHRLREHGLLASVDVGRQMLLVRRTLEGCAKQVIHLRVGDLWR